MLKQQRDGLDPARLGPSCHPAAQEPPAAEQVPANPPSTLKFWLWQHQSCIFHPKTRCLWPKDTTGQ